ncbi:MAG: hypothetical protein V3V08_19660 [Nannocystaceae bacterium]
MWAFVFAALVLACSTQYMDADDVNDNVGPVPAVNDLSSETEYHDESESSPRHQNASAAREFDLALAVEQSGISEGELDVALEFHNAFSLKFQAQT